MRVLDLFAGLGGWSAPFLERGHEVVSVDIEERFGTTIVADVLTLPDDMGEFDIICASPPCEKFSVMAFGHHWLPGYVPKHEATVVAMELVRKTVKIIEATRPAFWIVENPMGMLRKLYLLPYERKAVTYCQYGAPFRKETDLWGGFPPSWEVRRRCKNGDDCHVAAPRGSRGGIQSDTNIENKLPEVQAWYASLGAGSDPAGRAIIPPELALDVCLAAERDLALGREAPTFSGRLFV